MSETKHTPGPWLLGESMTGFVYALRKQGGVNRMTLQVQPGYTDADKRTSEVEIYANAQLIAAAPDLLEACKAVVKGYEGDGMEGMRNRDEVFYRECKAAIAKAEGAK